MLLYKIIIQALKEKNSYTSVTHLSVKRLPFEFSLDVYHRVVLHKNIYIFKFIVYDIYERL